MVAGPIHALRVEKFDRLRGIVDTGTVDEVQAGSGCEPSQIDGVKLMGGRRFAIT
jgi:hypothetical protein